MNEIDKKINELLYSFFGDMNKWEKTCYEIDNNSNLSYQEKELMQKKEASKIVERYLTKKERKMGLPNCVSYGHEGSYKYNPEEERIVFIEVEGNKAIILTEREKPMKVSNKYILKNVKGQWLIDSKKRYSQWKKKWNNVIL